MPRAAWNVCNATSVSAENVPSTTTEGTADTRCCCIQMTSSPVLPRLSTGQPGSGSTTPSGAGWVSAAQVTALADCQLHHDRPAAPYPAQIERKRSRSPGGGAL